MKHELFFNYTRKVRSGFGEENVCESTDELILIGLYCWSSMGLCD